MDPHSFIARAEAQRWLGISEKLLMAHDLIGSKTFAIRAQESDPRLEAAAQILAIADTLLAAEKPVVGNNGNHQPDFYAILQLDRFVQDTDHIASQYRRLAVILNPHQNRFPYSDQAFQLVNDAWAVLSNPMQKSMYDSEINIPQQQQMNTLGFNIEQPDHQQHQHNFFSINHEQKLLEQQQMFESRAQRNHQQHQLQQHNFLSQITSSPPQPPQSQPPLSWPEAQPQLQPKQESLRPLPQRHQKQSKQEHHQQQLLRQQHHHQQLQLEQQQKLKQEQERKLQQDQQRKLQLEQELKMQQEQERIMQQKQLEQQRKMQEEQERKLQLEQERIMQHEQQRKQQQEQQKLQEEQERIMQLEQQRKQQQEQEWEMQLEQQRKMQQEQQRKLQQEQEQKMQQEQEWQMQQEQERKLQEEQKRKLQQEQLEKQQKLQQEQQKLKQEQERQMQQEQERQMQEEKQQKLQQEQEHEQREQNAETETETETGDENVDDSPTFWTTCPYCFHIYEYPKLYADCTLRCDNCKRAFQAIRMSSPPPIIEGQNAYFYSWGFIPVGISISHLQKNNSTHTNSNWTPFSPLYDVSKNIHNHLNDHAAPKENSFVNKNSGPPIYVDDETDDILTGIPESSDDLDFE